MNKQIDFTRINNDVNGNGRLVCHFTNLLLDADKDLSIEDKYNKAVKRAKTIGGRGYDTTSYGGGIVFQASSPELLQEKINELLSELTTKTHYV